MNHAGENQNQIESHHLLAGILGVPTSVASQWISEVLRVEREVLYSLITKSPDVSSLLNRVHKASAGVSQSKGSIWYISASLNPLSNSKYALVLSLSKEYPGTNVISIETSDTELSLHLKCDKFLILEAENVITFTLSGEAESFQDVVVELMPRTAGSHSIIVEPSTATQRFPLLSLDVDIPATKLDGESSHLALSDPVGPRSSPQPDLILRVYRRPVKGYSFRLEYILYSPHSNLHLTGIPAHSVEVKRRELSKLRKRLEIALLQDQYKDLQAGLNILGHELYTLLFSKGEGGLASLYDRISDDIESWLILDDTEPWIPWELVKPHGSGWEHDFLGQRYSLGRWVEGWGAVRESEYPLGQVNYTQESDLSQPDTSVRSCLIPYFCAYRAGFYSISRLGRI